MLAIRLELQYNIMGDCYKVSRSIAGGMRSKTVVMLTVRKNKIPLSGITVVLYLYA